VILIQATKKRGTTKLPVTLRYLKYLEFRAFSARCYRLCLLSGNAEAGAVRLKQAPLKPKKKKNVVVQEQFDISPGAGSNEGKHVCTCKNCLEIVQVAKVVNTTKLSDHLTTSCKSIPANVKEKAAESTQRAKKLMKLDRLMPVSGKSLGEETLSDARNALSSAAQLNAPTPTKPAFPPSNTPSSASPKHSTTAAKQQTSISQYGQLMTKENADRIQRFDLETILVRFEPISRFDDPHHIAAVLHKCPALRPFVWTSQYALDVIVPLVDRELLEEINAICASTLGDANYSVDGVTALGRSYLMVTRSIGSLTNFVDLVQLRDQVHVSSAEAVAVCGIIRDDMRKLNERQVSSVRITGAFDVSSIAVDNAGTNMAHKVRTP